MYYSRYSDLQQRQSEFPLCTIRAPLSGSSIEACRVEPKIHRLHPGNTGLERFSGNANILYFEI
jgi:hypothetical protein